MPRTCRPREGGRTRCWIPPSRTGWHSAPAICSARAALDRNDRASPCTANLKCQPEPAFCVPDAKEGRGITLRPLSRLLRKSAIRVVRVQRASSLQPVALLHGRIAGVDLALPAIAQALVDLVEMRAHQLLLGLGDPP